jgi:hypothetical protein
MKLAKLRVMLSELLPALVCGGAAKLVPDAAPTSHGVGYGALAFMKVGMYVFTGPHGQSRCLLVQNLAGSGVGASKRSSS